MHLGGAFAGDDCGFGPGCVITGPTIYGTPPPNYDPYYNFPTIGNPVYYPTPGFPNFPSYYPPGAAPGDLPGTPKPLKIPAPDQQKKTFVPYFPFLIPVSTPSKSGIVQTPTYASSSADFDAAYTGRSSAYEYWQQYAGQPFKPYEPFDPASTAPGFLARIIAGVLGLFTPSELAPAALDQSQLNPQEDFARQLGTDILHPLADTDVFQYFVNPTASAEANPFNNPDYQPDPYAEPQPMPQPLWQGNPNVDPVTAPFPYALPGADPLGLPFPSAQPSAPVPSLPQSAPLQEIVVTSGPSADAFTVASPGTVPIADYLPGLAPLGDLGLAPATVALPGTGTATRVGPVTIPLTGSIPGVAPAPTPFSQPFAQPFAPAAPAIAPTRTVARTAQARPAPWAAEPGLGQTQKNCKPCKDEKKKKSNKRKSRDVCYKGTYYERANGLLKFRKERITCQ